MPHRPPFFTTFVPSRAPRERPRDEKWAQGCPKGSPGTPKIHQKSMKNRLWVPWGCRSGPRGGHHLQIDTKIDQKSLKIIKKCLTRSQKNREHSVLISDDKASRNPRQSTKNKLAGMKKCGRIAKIKKKCGTGYPKIREHSVLISVNKASGNPRQSTKLLPLEGANCVSHHQGISSQP